MWNNITCTPTNSGQRTVKLKALKKFSDDFREPVWTERQAIGKNYDTTKYANMKGLILGHANKY